MQEAMPNFSKPSSIEGELREAIQTLSMCGDQSRRAVKRAARGQAALKMLNAMSKVSASNKTSLIKKSPGTIAVAPPKFRKLSEEERQKRKDNRKTNREIKAQKRTSSIHSHTLLVERRKQKRNAQKD
jgi:hypothetical protein